MRYAIAMIAAMVVTACDQAATHGGRAPLDDAQKTVEANANREQAAERALEAERERLSEEQR